MRNIFKTLLVLPLAFAPVFGGGMILEIGNPHAMPAALAKGGVILARVTACQTPARANLVASAEGLVDGRRQTIPLKIDSLPEGGAWSIAQAWPTTGKWVVRLVATHPEYGTYASSVVVGVEGNTFDWAKVTRFSGKQPSGAEISEILAK
jgi:hypothetical protein